MKCYLTFLILLLLCSSFSTQAQSINWESKLPVYEIQVREDYQDFFEDCRWCIRETPAKLIYKGDTVSAMMRVKGQSSRDLPKFSWKLEFDDEY